jgi:hypothetical protein
MELKRANRFAVLCIVVLAVVIFFAMRENFQRGYQDCRDTGTCPCESVSLGSVWQRAAPASALVARAWKGLQTKKTALR